MLTCFASYHLSKTIYTLSIFCIFRNNYNLLINKNGFFVMQKLTCMRKTLLYFFRLALIVILSMHFRTIWMSFSCWCTSLTLERSVPLHVSGKAYSTSLLVELSCEIFMGPDVGCSLEAWRNSSRSLRTLVRRNRFQDFIKC